MNSRIHPKICNVIAVKHNVGVQFTFPGFLYIQYIISLAYFKYVARKVKSGH